MEEQELSYGQKYCGVTFNPGNNLDVDVVKQKSAQLVDLIQDEIEKKNGNENAMNLEQIQFLDAAKVKVLEAQMLAVKAITWQY